MQTDTRSWHSVSEVTYGVDDSYHVTSFRGWPHQRAADLLMRADNAARQAIRKVGGGWLFKNPHVYKK